MDPDTLKLALPAITAKLADMLAGGGEMPPFLPDLIADGGTVTVAINFGVGTRTGSLPDFRVALSIGPRNDGELESDPDPDPDDIQPD